MSFLSSRFHFNFPTLYCRGRQRLVDISKPLLIYQEYGCFRVEFTPEFCVLSVFTQCMGYITRKTS